MLPVKTSSAPVCIHPPTAIIVPVHNHVLYIISNFGSAVLANSLTQYDKSVNILVQHALPKQSHMNNLHNFFIY